MFLETEWWSMIPFMLGAYMLVQKKYVWTAILLTFTILIRETYLAPLGLYLLYGVMFERKVIVPILLSIAIFGLFFVYHIVQVNALINVWSTVLKPRVTPEGLFLIKQTLAFGSWEYLAVRFRPFLFVVSLAVVGCFSVYRWVSRREGIIWLLSFLPFPILFIKFGTVPYNDYWGVLYMPIALLLCPLSLTFLSHGHREEM